MMKKSLFFLIMVFIGFLKAKSQEFVLQGTLSGVEDRTEIRINPHLENGAVDMDDQTSIILKNGRFEFRRRLNRPTKFSLRTMPKIPPDDPLDFEYCVFWAENNNMTLRGIKGQIKLSKVTGSSIQNEYEEMTLEIANSIKKSRELFELSMTNRANLSEKERKEIKNQREQLLKEIKRKRQEFIFEHPNYYFTAEEIVFSINHFAHAFSKNEIKDFYDKMPLDLKTGLYGKKIADFLHSEDKYSNIVPLQIGDKPHDFILPDSEGTPVKFSTIRGRIILLDFWASGCAPCRKEHRNYVESYEKYKDKGFEIVSVSQDQSRDRWLNAMKKDEMTWVSLWDTDGKISRFNYLVTALPTNFLINDKGIIIAKNLRGEKLKSELGKRLE